MKVIQNGAVNPCSIALDHSIKHVDPGIRQAVMTQGPRDLPGGVLGAPGFHPRAHALFKVGDNPLGDAGVDIFLEA